MAVRELHLPGVVRMVHGDHQVSVADQILHQHRGAVPIQAAPGEKITTGYGAAACRTRAPIRPCVRGTASTSSGSALRSRNVRQAAGRSQSARGCPDPGCAGYQMLTMKSRNGIPGTSGVGAGQVTQVQR